MKRIHNNPSVRRTTAGRLNRSFRTVLVALAMFLAAASGWAKNYTITWTNVPAGSTGSIIYNGVATSSSATTLASVGSDFISASEITVAEIYVDASDVTSDVTYRGKATVNEATTTINITYTAVPQNEFTVAVQTATTTNLANIIYDGTNYVHGSVITFPAGTTHNSLAALLDAQSASCTVNIAGSQQTFDHIVFAPKDTPYDGSVDINDRYPAGLKVGDGNLAATYYPHYYVRMTVERQTLKIQYIGDRSNVPLRYEIYYDGERQLSRLTNGQVGEHFPQVDKDYPLEANALGYYDHYAASAQGPFSTLPYGVKVTNFPTTTVMDATTLQLQTAYTYQTIPFYPEGTRFSTIQQWFAANIGAATIDRTQVQVPDPTTADWANKHKGAYYFYNHNGELRIDSKTQVPTETEYQVIEGLEPGYGWAMIGNPYRFRIVNKLAGSGKYLRWVENANRGRVAGEVDGYFTFDDEGSEFSVLWNYSVKPGDYGWAGYLPNYDYNAICYAYGAEVAAQALGLNGYPPYAFGCTIALCPETSDGTEEKVLALTLDQDGDGNIIGVTMKELWLYTAMMTNPNGTPYIDPVTHQPVFFDGRGPADIATMRPDAHVYMGTLDTRFADMNYTVKVSVPSGATLAAGGVIYDEDFYADNSLLTFASQPATADFTSRTIDGYEGIVSLDHQNRFIYVTYLRHGATDYRDDYFYVRNTDKWAGYFIDDEPEGGWTVDPNRACLVHPIPAGSVSGINNGRTYAGVPAFYLYEQASGSYWIDDNITTSQYDATRYIFIDREGNVADFPQPGVTYAMVSERNLAAGDNISETWDPAPYGSSPSILSNLSDKSGDTYGCVWEFVPYEAPKAVKLNILYSDATGNRVTLPESSVQWGLANVPNGGTLYTIEPDDIPGLVIPVINPREDVPLLYIYNLNVAAGALTVIYQDTHSFKTRQDLIESVQQNRSFAIYNRNGNGFLTINTENGEAKAQIRGAWNLQGSGLATAEYAHPVQIFNGNAVWNVEVETDPTLQYYLRNAATGYYLAEDNEGNYSFSLSRTPIQTFDSLDEYGYFQIEVRPNASFRCGIDLTDPDHPIKAMTPSPLTQMQIVYPSENTTVYTLDSNVEAGGINLLATGANYHPGDYFYYTLPITDATLTRYMSAIPVDGYTARMSVTNDDVTHRGVIRVDYTPSVTAPDQPFFVRGATGYDNHGYFVSSGSGTNGHPMGAPTDVVPNTQVFTFESAGMTGGTPLYYIRGVAQTWNTASNDGYLNAGGTAYVDAAEQAGKFALIPVADKANTYYIAPSTDLNVALNWDPTGGYSEATDGFGLYPINDGVHDPFEIVPYTALTYHIVIHGADGGQGRVKFGAAELKDGDSFDVFVRLDSHDFNILPIAGTHYTWQMDGTTLTIEYLNHSMVHTAEATFDEFDTDRIAQDGSLYTLRTTESTQGHAVGDKGYYHADNNFVSDYEDITQNAIDYTDPMLLWQNVIYNGRLYSWSEAYQRPIGRSIPLPEIKDLLDRGTWFFEKADIKSVAPYYYFDVIGFPHLSNGAVGDPSRLRFKMPQTDLTDVAEQRADNPDGHYTHDTYFAVDANGHAEGPFVDVPQNLKTLVIEYRDAADQWQTLTPANCADVLGTDYPTVRLVGHTYTVTFTETLASLIARAEYFANAKAEGSADGEHGFLFPVQAEYDLLDAAIAAAKADGAADTPEKRQALSDAIAHFVRPDVPVVWPQGESDLVHIGNRKSGLYLYFRYGDVLSRLTDDRDHQPTSVWYFEKVAELPDGGTQVMLYNANGDPTPIIGYTAYQMGHPEWGGSLFNIHILSGGVFFDPMFDILQFDASGSPAAGTFYPHGTPEAKDRYSLLSNLLAGTPLDDAAQYYLGVKAAYSIEEMADMESAYWFARSHNVPAAYHRYDVQFDNVPAGTDETLFVEATPEAGLAGSDHTVARATADGFFILSDAEALPTNFTATDLGFGSTYAITFQKGTDGQPGTLTVTYSLDGYYRTKLQAEVTAAQAMLDNDPLTFGYPSQAVRDALQTVITAIQTLLTANDDAYFTAQRFTDQMQVLNTALNAYETTTDVITPQVGDVISLKGIIDNGSVLNVLHKSGRDLEIIENEDRNNDKLLDEIAATHDGEPDSYTNDYFWVVRQGDRPNYFFLESAYGDGLYLSSFGPSSVPTPWFFSAGTQKGRLSLYYYSVTGSRYAMTAVERDPMSGTVVSRDFANVQGHTHVSIDKQQTPDASTDFIVADSRNMVFSIRVLGHPTAKVTISLGSYDGQSMVNDGGFYSIGAADVRDIMRAAIGDAYDTLTDAQLLPLIQEGIASYVMGENIDGMEYTKECTITSYDRTTGYVTGAVVTFNYVDNLEALKERMNNVLNTASLVSGVFDIDDIAATRSAVNAATTRQDVLSIMRQFLRKSSGKSVTFTNAGSSGKLATAAGTSIGTTATAAADDSQFKFIYVENEAVRPYFYIYNVAHGTYLSPVTEGARLTCTSRQETAGIYVMEGIATNTVTLTNIADASYANLQDNGAGAVVGAVPNRADNYQRWGLAAATTNLPIPGTYYYLPGTTGTNAGGANCDNPAQMCHVTRQGNEFIIRPINGQDSRVTTRGAQTAYYTMKVAEAEQQTWTPVVLPEGTDQIYTGLLELYFMSTLPKLSNTYQIGYYYVNPDGDQTTYAAKQTAVANALKTNRGGDGTFDTTQAATAQLSLLSAIQSLTLWKPIEGFYRLRNVATGKYLTMQGASNDVVCPVRFITLSEADKWKDAESIFFFEGGPALTETKPVENSHSRLLNYANGQYLYATNVVTYPEYQADAKEFTIHTHAGSVGCYAFYYEPVNQFLASGINYTTTVNASDTGGVNDMQALLDQTTGWLLEEVTSLPVTIGAAGQATVYFPMPVIVPNALTSARYASNVAAENNAATPEIGILTESATNVRDSNIAARTPLVLHGTPGTYEFQVIPSIVPNGSGGFTVNTVTNNFTPNPNFTGIIATTPKTMVEERLSADQHVFVLMKGKVNGSEVIGFFKDYIGNLNGFKAYVTFPVSAGSNIRAFIIRPDGSQEGIDDILADPNADIELYDLSGRRITREMLRSNSPVIEDQGRKVIRR